MKKRFGLLGLAFLLVFSCFCSAGAEEGEKYATRGRVLEMILTAADAYYENLQPSDIMKGDGDGQLRENDPVIRVEAMAMLSRAFPDLPAASEYQYSLGSFGVTFTDLPQWAEADLSNLTRAGILAGYPDGRLGVEDYVTEEQMTLMIRRIWAYLGSNLKDDFYSSCNKPWLDTATLSASQLEAGTFQQADSQVSQRLQEYVEEVASKHWRTDTPEQRIKNFYLSALDTEDGNPQGLFALRTFLIGYDQAESLQELMDLHAKISKLMGDGGILGLTVDVDLLTGERYVPYVTGAAGILEKSYFTTEDEQAKEAYLNYVSDLLILGGEEKLTAKKHAMQLYEMEKDIALASLDPKDYYSFEKTYHRYQPLALRQLFRDFSPEPLLEDMDGVGFFVITDLGRVQKTIEYCTEDNLELLKTYMKFWLLEGCSSLLGEEFYQPGAELMNSLYGVELTYDCKQMSAQLVQGYLGEYLEGFYAKEYCSPQIKEDVTDLVLQLKEAFRVRLEQADWLGEETRKQAIEKLNSMILNIAYSEEFYDSYEGEYFENDLLTNALIVRSYLYDLSCFAIGQEASRDRWIMPCYTVNAAYDPSANAITIPAGILQQPFYDPDGEEEANLGGIGTIIAHEITHAFDDSGAQYDKTGRYDNWWTKEDLQAFQQKCAQVEEFYDGWEISNYAKCDGALTLGENVADLGGMACTLEVMKTLEDPDYALFFESYAGLWRDYVRREMVSYYADNDVHAPASLRVNRVVVNFQEFYDTYGIEPGDGMYVPPEERVSVW